MQDFPDIPPHENYFEDIRLMRQFLDNFPPYLSRQYELEIDEIDPNFKFGGPMQYVFSGDRPKKPKIEDLRIAAARMRKFSFPMTCTLYDDSRKDPESGTVKKYEFYWLILEIDYVRDIWYPFTRSNY